MLEKAIKVNHISKKYQGKYVLRDINFSVRAGTIHGFIGPNGAGKTTTLRILTRLVLPTSGEAYVDGKSVLADPTFNERLGGVSAEPNLPNYSVEEFLLEDVGKLRDIPHDKVLRELAGSPLSRLRSQNCRSLSTGQKKILQVFALALYKPKILLLDEPFNGLDPSARHDLFNELERSAKKGNTILMSTHILSDLQKFADNQELTFDMTMIKNGQIVYTGSKTADIEKTYEDYFIDKEKKVFKL